MARHHLLSEELHQGAELDALRIRLCTQGWGTFHHAAM
jgi:hypothetical protein